MDSTPQRAPRPLGLLAELTHRCPLGCPYCSNPLDIGHEKYRMELETEHWIRTFREARALGVLRQAYTRGLREAIKAEIDKDYVRMPVYEIEKKLAA